MVTEFFKNLADDTRLKIILLIYREQELCVCEITHALSLSQPKISRHIALLRDANILLDRRIGKWVYYRLSPDMLPWQQQTITVCFEQNLQYTQDNFDKLASMGNRPQRKQQCE